MWQLQEAYAKERARQRLADAADSRLARQVASVRRWQRLESFAASRLNRASIKVNEAYTRQWRGEALD